MNKPDMLEESFVITSVCREDLLSDSDVWSNIDQRLVREQIKGLTDAEMQDIAEIMADTYLEDTFWIHLKDAFEHIIERRTKNDRVNNSG